MTRYMQLRILLIFCVLTLGLSACSQEEASPREDEAQAETDVNPLIGHWLLERTIFKYTDREDRVEVPSDSTWFAFSENGSAIFTQRVDAAYHKQLYSWETQDSTLSLSSDIQLNTGEFIYRTSDSTLIYTRQLAEESIEGLTGWTYKFIRIDENNPVELAK